MTQQDLIQTTLALVAQRVEDGTASADDVVHSLRLNSLQDFLKHVDDVWTVQDVINSLSPEQRDAFDIIVGAAVEDEELDYNEELTDVYDSFNDDQEAVLDYIVGLALLDPELEHSGVKGMKWGVRKGEITGFKTGADGKKTVAKTISKADSKALRAKVKAGKGTLQDAHLASIKSRGHRVANATLGDKTYWKRTGVITAASLAALGGVALAPGAMPLAAFSIVGGVEGGARAANTLALGVRAVRGNTRISESLNALSTTDRASLRKPSQTGSKATKNVLKTNGSLNRKARIPSSMKQSDWTIGNFFKHFGIRGMKWGVRRNPGPDGTVSSAVAKAKADSDAMSDGARAAASLKTLKRGGVSALSNDDLRHLTNRLQLEVQFASIDRSKIGKLDTKVNKLLKYGKTMNKAIDFANSAAGQELSLLVRNKTTGERAKTPLARLLPKAEEAAAAKRAAETAKKYAKEQKKAAKQG